ncbi:hypothetical protein SJAV_23610 [Sulfurisphaera javensis]|uniref:Uncharacterized protein n=1 Tax=Sulfurisphaera javensis TaxID=2049879 RepID=A0AAT9GUH1_9CREN
MRIKLAYSREEELKPLIPLLRGEINNRGYEFVVEKIKEDEIKFNINKYDLLFIPLPVLAITKDVKVLSNGSMLVNGLYIKKIKKDEKQIKLLVNGTNSTEFYLAKIFLNNENIVPSFGDYNAIISYDEGDINLYEKWKESCGNIPIIISILGSQKLGEEDLLKLKVIIRESASLIVNKGEIPAMSKELGLKGREALECFFKLCKEKGICGEVKISLL